MAAEGKAWHEAAAKLCRENDDGMINAAVGDRSIFSLDDINLDDIFVDLNEADIPTFVTDNPSDGSLFASGDPHGSAVESVSQLGLDDTAGGGLLPEGLPCDDIDVTQLEWLSNFCEESYSSDSLLGFISGDSAAFGGGAGRDSGAAASAAVIKGETANFRSTSPISVLEHNSPTVGPIPPPAPLFSTAITSSCTSSLSSPTSSSCSGTGDLRRKMARRQSDPVIVPARSRSKRPRPASFSPRPPIVVPPPSATPLLGSAASAASGSSEEYDNFDMVSESIERRNVDPDGLEEEEEEEEEKTMKNTKMKKAASPPVTAEGEEAAMSSPQVRKCMHCQSTKTPQWRAGPSGPKTLCNACGVRYKSGRLFPEYRPAASPTYMASLHSNSHKRVVEMRNKDAVTEEGKGARQDVASKACELLHYIRVREWCADDRRGGVACD